MPPILHSAATGQPSTHRLYGQELQQPRADPRQPNHETTTRHHHRLRDRDRPQRRGDVDVPEPRDRRGDGRPGRRVARAHRERRQRQRHARGGRDRSGWHAGVGHRHEPLRGLQLDRQEGADPRAARPVADTGRDRTQQGESRRRRGGHGASARDAQRRGDQAPARQGTVGAGSPREKRSGRGGARAQDCRRAAQGVGRAGHAGARGSRAVTSQSRQRR